MFDRRKLLITLCMLACILLAGGFLGVNLLGWGALPFLASLYAEGWWTLLLIFPALTMFALDGYSRPALGLLASGLLLFANTHGLITAGMLISASINTALAALAGGAIVEITAKGIQRKKDALLLGEKKKKSLGGNSSAPSTNTDKDPFPSQPRQTHKSYGTQPQKTPQSEPFKQPSEPQKKNIYSRPTASWNGSAGSQSASSSDTAFKKGWDPNRTYRNPKDRRIYSGSTLQRQQNTSPVPSRKTPTPSPWTRPQRGVSASNSFPQSIAFFGESKVSSNHQDLSGGLVISLFGDAKLTLRDADYDQPITLSMLSLFGSSKVEVPYVSNIVLKPVSLFGDCRDKRNLVNSNAMPPITVRCISLFGDCRIM
jgi:hypothetical protein